MFANPPNQKKSSLNQSTHLSCLIPNNFSPSNFHLTSAHLAIKHYNLRFTDTLKKVTTSNFNVKLHKPLLTDLFDGLSQNVLLNVCTNDKFSVLKWIWVISYLTVTARTNFPLALESHFSVIAFKTFQLRAVWGSTSTCFFEDFIFN